MKVILKDFVNGFGEKNDVVIVKTVTVETSLYLKV